MGICIDCRKKTTNHATRCRPCIDKFCVGKNNPNYKHGKVKNNKCIDCNKHIWWGSTRCKSCSVKEHHKQGVMDTSNISNGNYIDGRSKLHHRIRASLRYKKWRRDILNRDNYTCRNCGDKKGGNLVAHHKKFFSLIFNNFINTYNYLDVENDIEVLLMLSKLYIPFWDINIGITLCKKCHKEIHSCVYA